MTNKQISTLISAAVAKAISKELTKAGRIQAPLSASKSGVDAKTDRVLKRRASIARGFAAKGIKVTFEVATGKFENVKPYKTWLSEGMVVRRGQHGVKGLFHVSQCDAYVAPVLPSSAGVAVTILPAESRAHFDTHNAA